MPGFNLIIGDIRFQTKTENIFIYDYIENDSFAVNRFSVDKFHDDKIFYDSENYFVLLEGIILNKKEYYIKGEDNWSESIIYLYKKFGDSFFKRFRGSFSGLLYDKQENKWIIFTDHIGSKHIYYSTLRKSLFVSSEISELYALFRRHHINYSLDDQGAYMALSYGYMLDDRTLCKEIKRLVPGCYMTFHDGDLSIHKYYSLPEKYDLSISEDDAIEGVDKLFRKAIQLQFEKDREYGYKHLVGLSGGLDSRMTSWVANDMGYSNQLNFTFSESDYLDETIAKKIASDLKHEWIFKALDNGVFLSQIDKINEISGGHNTYYGLAHSYSAVKYLNFKDLGILHTGQLGDVVISSFAKRNRITLVHNGEGAHSKKLLCKLDCPTPVLNPPIEYEKNLMAERGFNGALNGNLIAQQFTETMSPFYDIDFMDYCLQIPLQLRINHNIYKKWIIRKYPDAANYIWESTNALITKDKLSIKFKGKEIPIKRIPSLISEKFGMNQKRTVTKFHMNPLDYWYDTNPNIKEFQDFYFEQNIERLDLFPEIKSDVSNLYKTGTAFEKNQVLTLLSALNIFF